MLAKGKSFKWWGPTLGDPNNLDIFLEPPEVVLNKPNDPRLRFNGLNVEPE